MDEARVFEMPRGPAPSGTRAVGKDAVRTLLATRFSGIPDVHYGDDDEIVRKDSYWKIVESG